MALADPDLIIQDLDISDQKTPLAADQAPTTPFQQVEMATDPQGNTLQKKSHFVELHTLL